MIANKNVRSDSWKDKFKEKCGEKLKKIDYINNN